VLISRKAAGAFLMRFYKDKYYFKILARDDDNWQYICNIIYKVEWPKATLTPIPEPSEQFLCS
jgi:hypothetical protein